ncbi:MAG TPA: helix-turn-helix domain-containing protein [Chitinophagaceae bacterium]|jgi:DNA-binding HxlR family transcriptional regulator|nr:helix-turn-helix domain-containing protein [Chitinophagaceae bacterium]
MLKAVKATKPKNHKECMEALVPVQDALYVLNGKWKLPVIIALREGNKRFTDIQKQVKGIAAKVLSHELKELELNGFVERVVYDTTPVTVEYQVTPYTDTLDEVITALHNWGLAHRNKIRAQMREKKAI